MGAHYATVHQNMEWSNGDIPTTHDHDVQHNCLGCKGSNIDSLFTLQVPADCSVLFPTGHAARACQQARIDIVFCRRCGLIFNRSYDSTLLRYDEHYDNSLSASPSFQDYARKLVYRLCETYSLERKRIIEIGCGKGDFLRALCDAGNSYGTGYDPSFVESAGSVGGTVKFVQDYYSEAYTSEPVDFLCCRHVLEHIENPFEFLCFLRRSLASHDDVAIYFEVPNAHFVFSDSGLWDIIYPHVCYFSLSALDALFRRAGFEILRSGTSFGNQFLYLEAHLPSESPISTGTSESKTQARPPTEAFKERFQNIVVAWSSYLQAIARERKRVAFWGAGAKGVTFLNLVPHASKIECVVDSNVRKQGMYVPGTGQPISSPDHLRNYQPDIVIVLNPLYAQEISSTLSGLDVKSEVVSSL
jgi:SAM-dependent methyltransferase